MKEDINYFAKLIKTRGNYATILYRGTENGFRIAEIYSKIRNKEKTISLI